MLALKAPLAASSAKLAGPSADDKALARRTEIKFTLPRADLGALRRVLDGRGRRIAFNERVSTVRSIYFDDVHMSACRANLDGLSRRSKLRLRWYDSLVPNRDVVLEIKWRDNRTTGKKRLHLRSDVPLAELSYRQIVDWLIDHAPQEHQAMLWQASEPVVLVEYHREHFAAADGGVRATLDYDLVFYDQVGKSSISTSFPRRLGDRVIVEVKGPHGIEHQFRSAIYPLRLRVRKCSKYVEGCRLLGYVHHGE